MPQSNRGGSNKSTGKQSGDKQHSSQSGKEKTGQDGQHGVHGQKGKEDMGKGKINNQREESEKGRSGSNENE